VVESDAADFLDGDPPARLQELHKAHGTTRESLIREAIDKASQATVAGNPDSEPKLRSRFHSIRFKFSRSSCEGVVVFPRVGATAPKYVWRHKVIRTRP
jgi:hypothetical protein